MTATLVISALAIVIFIGLINGIASFFAICIVFRQVIASSKTIATDRRTSLDSEKLHSFVSIHVATYDEPPAMVIATINALVALDYPAFEVVIIDNNTPDAATWQPVERHIETLGPSFRFLHADNVVGAKAGALNIALQITDPRAEFIAVVDADYQVTPDFLILATTACADYDFVQFPQAYRNSVGAKAVCNELSDYFSFYPSAANQTGAALLTGTLSLIAISALRSVGGWPTWSITEDAELGVRLWQAGARGRYISQIVGTGLLPLDLNGLRQQRNRWAAGNVQTLRHALAQPITLLQPGGVAVAAQLTAWTGFMAVPLITLGFVGALRLGNFDAGDWLSWAQWLATATIAINLLAIGARAFLTGRLSSVSVTLAMLWTSSFAWLPAMFGQHLRFKRTPKSITLTAMNGLTIDTVASLLALGLSTAFMADGSVATAIVLALSSLGLITGLHVDRTLRLAGAANA